MSDITDGGGGWQFLLPEDTTLLTLELMCTAATVQCVGDLKCRGHTMVIFC